MPDSVTPTGFRLDGKVAIIAGVGETNSRHIALALADAGADVVLAARRTVVTEPLAAEIRATGRRALAIQADLSVSEQVDAMVARARAELGRIDILFNHGAVHDMFKPVIDYDDHEWRRVFAFNLDLAFFATRAVAKVMIEQGDGGSIINTSSTASVMVPPLVSVYGIAKAGLNQFTRCMAVELAPHRIRVNTMLFGTFENAGPTLNDMSPGFGDWWLRETPMGRWGLAHESAGTALYLASPASSFVTGALIAVSGGIGIF